MSDGLKLTTYFGERDRTGAAFTADALTAIYAHHGVHTSAVFRGVEGFGAAQHRRTDRLLTLSEDLPVVAVAIDDAARIEAVAAEVAGLAFRGLTTLERVRLPAPGVTLPAPGADEALKLTVYLGRQERAAGIAAHEAVVALLHDCGVAGATVLLGVDGTAAGVRRRATFFGRNAAVPVMVIAVGDAASVQLALGRLPGLLEQPLTTLERVRVCKRDGQRLADPGTPPAADADGNGVWQKLMVYSGEQSRHDGAPLHLALVRALREAGAAGATCLRGIWGYHGDHAPHGDAFWQLRRRVPVVTVVVDTPERCARWYGIVDAVTAEAGLVTGEVVPAALVTGPGGATGGLRLARP